VVVSLLYPCPLYTLVGDGLVAVVNLGFLCSKLFSSTGVGQKRQ
jgi:hypothetical protein